MREPLPYPGLGGTSRVLSDCPQREARLIRVRTRGREGEAVRSAGVQDRGVVESVRAHSRGRRARRDRGRARHPARARWLARGRTRNRASLSTLDRKFGDVLGEHQAAFARGERVVFSFAISRRRSRRVNRH
jgi:hypothetical protein